LCYFGGVQEVLAPTLQNGYEYDVNSEYPFCMQKEMPVGNPILFNNPTQYQIFDDKFLWYVKADVFVPPQIMPPIPVRTEQGLLHPVGYFTCHVASSELKYAVDKCGVRILKIH
jgi:hypothetical protein